MKKGKEKNEKNKNLFQIWKAFKGWLCHGFGWWYLLHVEIGQWIKSFIQLNIKRTFHQLLFFISFVIAAPSISSHFISISLSSIFFSLFLSPRIFHAHTLTSSFLWWNENKNNFYFFIIFAFPFHLILSVHLFVAYIHHQ